MIELLKLLKNEKHYNFKINNYYSLRFCLVKEKHYDMNATLYLIRWIETFDGKYIDSSSDFLENFLKHIDDFREEFQIFLERILIESL